LPDLASRKKFASARVAKLVDVALDELLSLQPLKLTRKLNGAQVVVVRSHEMLDRIHVPGTPGHGHGDRQHRPDQSGIDDVPVVILSAKPISASCRVKTAKAQ
jgi:hypothetical protein